MLEQELISERERCQRGFVQLIDEPPSLGHRQIKAAKKDVKLWAQVAIVLGHR
jgi:hypothetical protein